jgi:hypothetical protein
MPTFEFWYDETYTYKAWFDAENLEEAKKLLDKVTDGEINIDQLPEFGNKDKGYKVSFEHATIEEN